MTAHAGSSCELGLRSRPSQEFEDEIRLLLLPDLVDAVACAPRDLRGDLVAVAVRDHGEWTAVIVQLQIAEEILAAVEPGEASRLRRLREPIAAGGLRVVVEVLDAEGRWVGVMRFVYVSAKGGLA